MDISGNKLSGSVPTELVKLDSLDSLSLVSNKLCSSIPTELQALSSSVTNYKVTTGNSMGALCTH